MGKQNFDLEVVSFLGELKNELKKSKSVNDLLSNERLKDIGIKLATIIPQGDFIDMFMKLEDYNFDGKYSDNRISDEIIQSIYELGINDIKDIDLSTQRRADCNCRWTCGELSGSHTNCNETSIGCGWFGLGSCTGKY